MSASELNPYDRTGRTITNHRAQIRDHLRFRVCGVADAEKPTQWSAAEVAHTERHLDRVREEPLRHCRQELSFEPNSTSPVDGWSSLG